MRFICHKSPPVYIRLICAPRTSLYVTSPLLLKSGCLNFAPYFEQEAVYFSTSQDSTGAPLFGSNSYILNLVPPPNRAFWCLIVYNATNLFLPYGQTQYEITNRTGPLPNQNSNGSYTIFVQVRRPERANFSRF